MPAAKCEAYLISPWGIASLRELSLAQATYIDPQAQPMRVPPSAVIAVCEASLQATYSLTCSALMTAPHSISLHFTRSSF